MKTTKKSAKPEKKTGEKQSIKIKIKAKAGTAEQAKGMLKKALSGK